MAGNNVEDLSLQINNDDRQILIVNFSGGRSSARMVGLVESGILYNPLSEFNHYDAAIYVFCNTGCEHEKTLDFVDKVDKYFGLNLVWLEAVTNPTNGKGTRHKIVTYETASRRGEPFEAMIKKHGIPNMTTPHCTRELKTNTTISYLRSLGLRNANVTMAIGFRSDEPRRFKPNSKVREIYPLATADMDKADVNLYWEEVMPFDLEIEDYEGNCVWCWKKSNSKHYLNIIKNREYYDFPMMMEEKYGKLSLSPVEKKRTFFRDYVNTKSLIGSSEIMCWDDETLKQIIKRGKGVECGSECTSSYLDINLDDAA